ncbi:MAG: NYN domain-containing protein [Oscillospiraceae bacterium]|nr:NYN domain-containing protein [Oscillospiraceae bacterium]
MQANDLRLAVLIDAENIPRRSIKNVMEEIAIYGTPTIKRIYGDWTSPVVGNWKAALLENAITPVQQYSYTTGKNSTDSAMIIDAMDILYTGNVDGFCIVSSDSDFTRLAIRLREAGMRVIGIGEKKTPKPFVATCDKFIYIEVIMQNAAVASVLPEIKSTKQKKSENKPAAPEKPAQSGVDEDTVKLIAASVSDIADDDGYAFLGELGNLILKKQPDFDPRNFGFSKLTPLIRSLPRFEIDVRLTADPHIKHIYVRDKLTGKDNLN